MTKKEKKYEAMRLLRKIKDMGSAIRDIENAMDYLVQLYVRDNAKFRHNDMVKRKGSGQKEEYRIYGTYFATSDTISYYAIGNSSKETFEEDEIRLVKK